MTSVNLLIVLIVGALVGTFTGLVLGGVVDNLYLAMIAGILATIVAGIVRNTIMTRVSPELELEGMPSREAASGSAVEHILRHSFANDRLLCPCLSCWQHVGCAGCHSERGDIVGSDRNIGRALLRNSDGDTVAGLRHPTAEIVAAPARG